MNEFSFKVSPGECTVLLGANGAGKSTLLKILAGSLLQDTGTAAILGEPTTCLSNLAKSRLAVVFEETTIPHWSTANEFAALFGQLYSKFDFDYYLELLAKLKIDLEQKNGTMSKGQRRYLELSLWLATYPELLILDEPFEGLDALMRLIIIKELTKLNKNKNASVFFSSHIISEAQIFAEHVLIVKNGALVFDAYKKDLNQSLEQLFINHHPIE